MEYIIVKWLHIVSSTFLFGTGIGSAFYLFFASLKREPLAVAFVARHVVKADWLFTATTVVFQPASGFYLAYLADIPVRSTWITASTALYLFAVGCWLPVARLQYRMRDAARRAVEDGSDLPPDYWRAFRIWIALGFPALFAFIAIFYLMVAKPL
ncbi:MAG: DUF2269 family protein [Thiobacillus sp.]